jgi:hypothetical protein
MHSSIGLTSEQMLALFGAGGHPLAAHRLQQLSDANLSDDQVRAATRLGAPFRVMRTTPNRFLMIARCWHRDLGDTKTCFDARGTRKDDHDTPGR